MTYVMAAPQLMEAAATDLATIGSTLNAAHMAAAAPIAALPPAAADEVSASIAHLFSDYGQDYQKLAGQAAVFHDQFVQRLTASANAYASAEAASASSLRPSTASASSIGSGVAAAQDQVVNLFTATVNQMLNSATSILGPLGDTLLIFAFIPPAILFLLAILFIWAITGPTGPMVYPSEIANQPEKRHRLSAHPDSIERMFGSLRLHEHFSPSDTDESRACATARRVPRALAAAHNRDARLARKSDAHDYFGPAPPFDDDPPPF